MAIRRRPVFAEFTDQYGEQQVIHRGSSSRLQIRRNRSTVSLAMSKAIGKIVGQRIKEARVVAGLTMPRLAERAGLLGGKQTIYGIEEGLSTGIRLGTLYAIAAALNVSPLSLLPPMSDVMEQTGAQMQQDERLAV